MTNESADDLTTLDVCSDDALWATAESSLSPAQQRRLEQLSTVADTRSMTPAESSELTDLMEQYDDTDHLLSVRTAGGLPCRDLRFAWLTVRSRILT